MNSDGLRAGRRVREIDDESVLVGNVQHEMIIAGGGGWQAKGQGEWAGD